MSRYRLKVPASTSNLGPGFDVLGLALGLYNTADVELDLSNVSTGSTALTITGEGADRLPSDRSNLVMTVAHEVAQLLGKPMCGATIHCHNNIPLDRGLGSSSTAIVLGILLANLRTQSSLSRDEMLAIATRYEGHPDNVAPAIFGGLQVSVMTEGSHPLGSAVQCISFDQVVKKMPSVVVFVPDFRMPTKEARAVLPSSVSMHDAVFNLSRVALLLAGLATGNHSVLREATRDRFHQTQRSKIFHALPLLLERAYAKGALAAWLSGAGSTVAAFAENDAQAALIGEEFCSTAQQSGLTGRAMVLAVDLGGAVVEKAS